MEEAADAPDRPVLRVRAAHVAETSDGALLTRGTRRLSLSGRGAFTAVELLLRQLADESLDREAFLARVEDGSRASFANLIDHLLERGFLEEVPRGMPAPAEDPEAIFYWEVGRDVREVRDVLDRLRPTILGVNDLSRQLCSALRAAGCQSFRVVDVTDLRNPRFFDDEDGLREGEWDEVAPLGEADFAARWDAGERPVCLVATAEFGARETLRRWNERCVDDGVHYLPVGLREGVGTIGPLVVPGETPCYECARGRENSNTPDPTAWRAQEQSDPDTRGVAGHHPLAPRILGELTAFELCRFYTGLGFGPIGRVLTVSLLDMELRAHKLLRLPRCPACGRFHARPRVALGSAYRPQMSEQSQAPEQGAARGQG